MANDEGSGESVVRCGEGVLALRSCRFDGEPEAFAPGRRWRSIRLRLGMRAENWPWLLSRRGPGPETKP